jgi:hypothetical protein
LSTTTKNIVLKVIGLEPLEGTVAGGRREQEEKYKQKKKKGTEIS